jgi:hypothetical protein
VLVDERENCHGDRLQPACFGISRTILLPASDYDAMPEAEVLAGLGLHVIGRLLGPGPGWLTRLPMRSCRRPCINEYAPEKFHSVYMLVSERDTQPLRRFGCQPAVIHVLYKVLSVGAS